MFPSYRNQPVDLQSKYCDNIVTLFAAKVIELENLQEKFL